MVIYKRIIIDSSVWLSFLNRKDSNHKRAKKIFGKFTDPKIILLSSIYSEVASILQSRYKDKRLIQNFIHVLQKLNTDITLTDKEDFKKTNTLFLQDFTTSFVDAKIVQYAISKKCELVTFDKKMEKLYKKIRFKKKE